MDFSDTPEEARFREEVRSWLSKAAKEYAHPPAVPFPEEEFVARGRAWQRKKAEAGYGALIWPKKYGGMGASPIQNLIFQEEERKYHIPLNANIVGLRMCIPTILHHGTPEQVERFTRPSLYGDMIWCQLFSEPAAGSDLAGVRIKAERKGEKWIINGQKIWNSWAHRADYGILVARTDVNVPKHKGLTFFVIDMKTPGIEPKPIKQMSGKSEFNETFFTDVEIDDSCRLGEAGNGWAVAMTTLMYERMGASGESGGGPTVRSVVKRAAKLPGEYGTALDSEALRAKLAVWFARERGVEYFRYRALTRLSKGEAPGPESALGKLVSAKLLQDLYSEVIDMQGYSGLVRDPQMNPGNDPFIGRFLQSAAHRIAAGTDEILRNQISERVLNLPSEIRSDKTTPFKDLPIGR